MLKFESDENRDLVDGKSGLSRGLVICMTVRAWSSYLVTGVFLVQAECQDS